MPLVNGWRHTYVVSRSLLAQRPPPSHVSCSSQSPGVREPHCSPIRMMRHEREQHSAFAEVVAPGSHCSPGSSWPLPQSDVVEVVLEVVVDVISVTVVVEDVDVDVVDEELVLVVGVVVVVPRTVELVEVDDVMVVVPASVMVVVLEVVVVVAGVVVVEAVVVVVVGVVVVVVVVFVVVVVDVVMVVDVDVVVEVVPKLSVPAVHAAMSGAPVVGPWAIGAV